ncbi:MAG: metallophosphoesterase family protein [Clostridia bacterium]|nr:metallophosphoesterase family protein [Clostridia bacterium]
MQNKALHFKNGTFRIMQIADIQEPYYVSSNTLRLINAALDEAKPDLVVLTGDQLKGYSPTLMGQNRRERVEDVISRILKPMASRGIPVTATFGNHDDQCGISNSEQMEIYKKCPSFVYNDPADFGDDGTFYLTVDDRFIIYLFDTHAKDGHGGYGMLRKDQIEWYRKVRDEFEEKNGTVLPSMAFQHIPTPEFFDVLKQTSPLDTKGIRAYGTHKYKWYTLDPHNSGLRDFLGETPASSYVNSGEVDAFLEKKDVKALFVGHDHKCSYVSKYKDIYLGFTQSCGFSAYGPDLNRGVRCIDISPDGSFETRTLTYYELCGTTVDDKLAYTLRRFAPASVAGVKTAFMETGALLGTAGAIAGLVAISKKFKR